MQIFWIILTITGVYFFLVFFVLRIVVPFMGFGGLIMPRELPKEVSEKITELKTSSADKNAYLQTAYNFVVARWHAGRLDTIFYAPLAFRKNILSVWQRPGYAHWNTQNYLLFLLLVGSKFFTPQDIKLKTVFVNFFIHQYLQVKVGEKWLDVDPAGASIRGKPFGHHLRWFG